MHLGTAARLREMGWESPARRAEQFAAWARFDLEEPQAARRLHAAAGELRGLGGQRLLSKVLEGGLSLGRADRGHLRLMNEATGELQTVAEHGFGPQFLEHFAAVDDDRSACGKAVKRRAQVVIVDVMSDPGFVCHRAIAAASGFRAVLSTPLINRDGRLIGVVCTHYPRPYCPPERDRQVIKRYGEIAGWVIADHFPSSLRGRVNGWPATVAGALRRAARAHDHVSEAYEGSSRLGVGDVAEHKRLAEFHRVAAEADRQRADEVEAKVVATRWADADRSEAMPLKSQALVQKSQAARARARATREQIERGRSEWEILQESAFARLQAKVNSTPVIEQARGIVMAQHGCGPAEAFVVLHRMSQHTDLKLHVLAARLVEEVTASKKSSITASKPAGDRLLISPDGSHYLRSGLRVRPSAAQPD